jgi:hypothetical protein
VIVIDSGSHEYEGIGGVLEMQQAEFERMGSRDSMKMASWIAPKQRHKRFVQQLLRARAHVIVCLRAEDKIEVVKEGGKTVVRPKESLIGAQGWIPICEKRFPFEATISLLLTADAPGVPKPIKLERRHAGLVPLDRVLDENVGVALAEWAAGSATPEGALSMPELKAKIAAAGIDGAVVGDVGKRLFPGRSASALTDAERGQVWAEVEASLQPVAAAAGEEDIPFGGE